MGASKMKGRAHLAAEKAARGHVEEGSNMFTQPNTYWHDEELHRSNLQEVEVTFHNVDYILTLDAPASAEAVIIEVERKSDGNRWRGNFAARYIEEITHKTGNFKKFPVFLKMLSSSLTQESDSVFIDLLTYDDLEMLKNRKSK